MPDSGLTPEQRSLRARAAAHARWSREDPSTNARRGQAGLRKRFLDEVDPSRELPEAERERRADQALRAHMAKLALKSSKDRAARGDGAA